MKDTLIVTSGSRHIQKCNRQERAEAQEVGCLCIICRVSDADWLTTDRFVSFLNSLTPSVSIFTIPHCCVIMTSRILIEKVYGFRRFSMGTE